MFDSIVLLFVFTIIYMLIIEVFTVLFRFTGLTEEKARFQVISLLTACGFTTSQSEAITVSRIRRQLAAATILFGYIFSLIIVSIVVNVFLSLSASESNTFISTALIMASLALLVFIFVKSKSARVHFDALVDRIYSKISKRSPNNVTIMDVLNQNVIAIVQLSFLPDFLNHVPLKNSGLRNKYHLQVMVVSRNGKPIEPLTGETILHLNDEIILFGNEKQILELFEQ